MTRKAETVVKKEKLKPCPICDGTGYLENLDRHFRFIKTTCLICNGTGQVNKKIQKSSKIYKK